MSEDGLGCLATTIGIAGLVATFALGPIDLGRSVYNQIVGDTPVLKRQLLDYSRSGIQRENPGYSTQEIENKLRKELGHKLDGEVINPQDVEIGKLWDASEDHARSFYERFVWPSLD